MVKYNYCSICGAGFRIPSDEQLLSYIKPSSYQKPITDDDVLWLSRFRIWGRYGPQAEDSIELRQQDGANGGARLDPCFITGPGRFRRSKAEFLRGEMVGLPFGEGCSSVKGEGPGELLSMQESWLWAFIGKRPRYEEVLVFHQVCYDSILSRVIENSKRGNSFQHKAKPITLIKLHDCLLKQRIIGDRSSYSMFGLSSEDQDVDGKLPGMKYWSSGSAYILCDPVPVDWISSYITGLPVQWNLDLSQTDLLHPPRAHLPSEGANGTDPVPFSVLPLDCILAIVDLLSTREVLLLSLAVPVVSQRLENSDFWRRRASKDMPWLWELDSDIVPDDADWRSVYFDLWNKCTYGHQTRLLGLLNRKRIWKICSSIVDRCLRMGPDTFPEDTQR